MSCERGWNGRSPDIAASFLRVRLQRDDLEVAGLFLEDERLRSTGDAADKAGASEGALQLIARLNGKRSPASRLSALGYGAPPPDHDPAPERAPAARAARGWMVAERSPAPRRR